jgi:hypothetical protein
MAPRVWTLDNKWDHWRNLKPLTVELEGVMYCLPAGTKLKAIGAIEYELIQSNENLYESQIRACYRAFEGIPAFVTAHPSIDAFVDGLAAEELRAVRVVVQHYLPWYFIVALEETVDEAPFPGEAAGGGADAPLRLVAEADAETDGA